MKKSLVLLATMLGSLAVTAFLFRPLRSDLGVWLLVLVMMLVVYIPFGIPAAGKFITSRPRATFWTGVGLAVGGWILIFVFAFTSSFYGVPKSMSGSDWVSLGVSCLTVLGISLAMLPRAVASAQRANMAASQPQSTLSPGVEFSGLREGWTANVFVVRKWRTFARLEGAWIILLWTAPYIGLHLVAYLNGTTSYPIANPDPLTREFGELLPSQLIAAIAFPSALVAWHRSVLDVIHSRSILVLPDKSTWRYLWRLWMVLFALGVFVLLVVSNSPDLARLLGLKNPAPLTTSLIWSVLAVGTYLGSNYALALPATAIGNRDFIAMDSLRVTKPLGNSYRMGFVLSLLPFGILWWSSADVLQRLGLEGPSLSVSLPTYTLRLIPMVAAFLMLTSCATYISRVYASRVRKDLLDQLEEPISVAASGISAQNKR